VAERYAQLSQGVLACLLASATVASSLRFFFFFFFSSSGISQRRTGALRTPPSPSPAVFSSALLLSLAYALAVVRRLTATRRPPAGGLQ
jgi:hypothetical protein